MDVRETRGRVLQVCSLFYFRKIGYNDAGPFRNAPTSFSLPKIPPFTNQHQPWNRKLWPSSSSTFPKTNFRHIQAMLTPLAARKAQLQRALSVNPPNLPQKPSGSTLVKGGERKPSHRVERDDSLRGRSIKGSKNFDRGVPVNALVVEDEVKEVGSWLPVST